MSGALALGLGVGAGVQAFRQWPPDGPLSTNAVTVLFIAGLLAAYFGGRRRSGSTAVAVATATASSAAEASNVVNVQLFSPGAVPERSILDVRVPEPGTVAWLDAPTAAALEPDVVLDGMSLEDLGYAELPE
jgi:hypothetical protein